MNLKILSNEKIIVFIVSLALFMSALDATIINTAIPAMAQSLKVNPINLKIALISYLLSLTIFIPISGWAADKFGIKRVFVIALIIFTASSLWCGYAHLLYELVIARSIQGIGGALMLPLGRLIILHTFKRHKFVEAMGAVIMVSSMGVMLGPLVGGVLTDHLSWHWIFWVNIPVGLLTIVMAACWLKETEPKKVRAFDLLGFILIGGGLAGLTFSLADLSETVISVEMGFILMGVSAIMLVSYFLRLNAKYYPIIDIKIFRIRTFKISFLGNLFTRVGFGGAPFLLPILLQVGLGYSAQVSGLLLVPIAIGIWLVKFRSLALKLLRLLGYKRLLIINTLLIGLSLCTFKMINAQASIYFIVLLILIFGFLISLQFSAMNSLAYAEIESENLSGANSIFSMTQQLAQGFGVAISALLLQYYSSNSTHQFLLTPPTFHKAFIAMGIITMLSAFIFIKLKPDDGHQMLSANK